MEEELQPCGKRLKIWLSDVEQRLKGHFTTRASQHSVPASYTGLREGTPSLGTLLPQQGQDLCQCPLMSLSESPVLAAVLGPCCCWESLSDPPALGSACEIIIILCKIITAIMQERGFSQHELCSKHIQQPQASRVLFPGCLPPLLLPTSQQTAPVRAGPGVSRPVTDACRAPKEKLLLLGEQRDPNPTRGASSCSVSPSTARSSSSGSSQAGNSSLPREG